MPDRLPDSISDTPPQQGPRGQLSHPEAIQHLDRLQEKFYAVGNKAWCYVGNGLSNQTFIEAPQGIIAIDTGECVEEMRAALKVLREHTQLPVVACIYTHFHYVAGTRAILEEPGAQNLQIYGHAGIEGNLARFGGEIAPRATRGLVHQFGNLLPAEGEDALLHAGLGRFFRNPDHAPYTPGYMPAHHTFDKPTTLTIAGLEVHLQPAPSDATDSITLWFPSLGLCVNNLIWPALINIYAIRGEAYRDPRVLLEGIDALAQLQPDHLIGTHGPPLSGADIAPAVQDYRDAIQFLWDQTVRAINAGLRLDEVVQQVQLPKRFKRSYFTQQLYGLAEHHVRQIHNGLFGWLDEDEQHLFPLGEGERAKRLVRGFGGAEAVRKEIDAALANEDWRWAAEMSTWLCRLPNSPTEDQQRLATCMRNIAQRTTSANVRNWCLTRALELEGQIDLQRFRGHRFRFEEVSHAPPERFVPVLRVLLDPGKAQGLEDELAWHFSTGQRLGLKIRNQVAIPTNGEQASNSITLSPETWAKLLANRLSFTAACDEGLVSTLGDEAQIQQFLGCFDVPALQATS